MKRCQKFTQLTCFDLNLTYFMNFLPIILKRPRTFKKATVKNETILKRKISFNFEDKIKTIVL